MILKGYRRKASLARLLHHLVPGMCLHIPIMCGGIAVLGQQAGCVVPQPLEQESESFPQRPRISSLSEPRLDSELTVEQSDSKEFKIVIEDEDSQVIHIRMFLDADYRTKIHETQAVGNKLRKQAIFTINGLCGEKVDFLIGRYQLELYASDKEFDSIPGDLRLPLEGGFRDNVMWELECIEDVLTLDGGT